jgi:signal transduction histidine kinase
LDPRHPSSPPDAAPDDAALEAAVEAERVELLYQKGLTALIANLVNALVLVVALRGAVSQRVSLAWLFAMYTVVSLRIALWNQRQAAPRRPGDVDRWRRVWLVGTSVTGLVWGAAGFFLHPGASTGREYLLLFIIGGMVAGASASMSSSLPAFCAFTAPALAPPIARLVLERDRLHAATALLFFIFAVGMTSVARSGARSFTQSVKLRVRNAVLVRRLEAARQELLRANLELEQRVASRTAELNRALTDRESFISVVSHELRTPLTSMKIRQELLERDVAGPAPDLAHLRRDVPALAHQIERMQRLIGDLLDLSRLSTERMRYEKHPLSLRAIVDDALEQMAPQLEQARVSFAVDVAEGLDGEWDGYRIQQAIVNLMSNAVRHGREPFSLRAFRTDDRVRIVVHDSGAGIPSDRLRRIFEPYEGSGARKGGLGLGLYIAERIVVAHGGSVHAESAPGQGATFVVELPRRNSRSRGGRA